MAKRGTYVGGSTVFGRGSNWFGHEREETQEPPVQKPQTFQDLIRESLTSQSSGKGGFDLQRDARNKERREAKLASWKPETSKEARGSFVVEKKRPRRARGMDKEQVDGDEV